MNLILFCSLQLDRLIREHGILHNGSFCFRILRIHLVDVGLGQDLGGPVRHHRYDG
jgi:hypothetical protein